MNQKYYVTYTIAGITVCLEAGWQEKISDDFKPFLGDNGKSKYLISFQQVEQLEEFSEEYVFKNQGFAVFPNKEYDFIRRFHDARRNEQPYATTKMNLKDKKIIIEYLVGYERFFGNSRNDFFHIGWERILLNDNRIILHSACVETPMGGVLFSGPSGIGKSTQANLWCQYTDSKLLNGDRVILRKQGKEWFAYGSPYAGSSRCYLNKSCTVKAIVMLKKNEECNLRKLDILESFRRVFGQLTINSWDREFVSKAYELTMQLIKEIPVYELACTPDEKAVELLLSEFQRRNVWI